MPQKYHQSVKVGRDYHNMTVVSATYLDGMAYVATSNTKYPVLKFETCDGRLKKHPEPVRGYEKVHIKYINMLKDYLAVIPKNHCSISVLKDESETPSIITVGGKPDLKHALLNSILKSYPKSCRCESCYHMVGFEMLHDFHIFVQLLCKHKPENNVLYVIRGHLDLVSLELAADLNAVNEYNLYRLFKDRNLDQKYAETAAITAVHFDNKHDAIYILSTYEQYGHLWRLNYMSNISYISPPEFVTKLRRQPSSVLTIDDKLAVLSDNILENKMYYYLIETHDTE